jgi:hypothetical protein
LHGVHDWLLALHGVHDLKSSELGGHGQDLTCTISLPE